MAGDTGRLPLFHPTRIKLRDDKMWQRECKAGRLTRKVNCSCTDCMGMSIIREQKASGHLLHRGRAPVCLIKMGLGFWHGPDQDDSDEEWARDYIPNFGASSVDRANLNKYIPGENVVIDSQVEVNALVDEAFIQMDDEGQHFWDRQADPTEPGFVAGDDEGQHFR